MAKTKHGTIEVGYWLAVCVKEGTAPLRCYVGTVQAVDTHGIRIRLIDWLIMSDCGYDFFTAWDNIQTCYICTPEHDVEGWLSQKYNYAGNWQTGIHEQAKQD